MPGAWRVSKPQATGGRRWGKRDPPDGQCRWVVNTLGGWLSGPRSRRGLGDPVARCGFSGIILLVSTSFRPDFPPSRVNRNVAEIAIQPSFFHSFWPIFRLFFGRLDFDCSPFPFGPLCALLACFRFFIWFPQPIPYIRERNENKKPFEIRKGTCSCLITGIIVGWKLQFRRKP